MAEAEAATAEEDILTEALKRFEQGMSAWSINIDLARQDIRFANGNSDNGWQWPDQIRQQRFRDKRPCLTINQLPQFVRQITNEMRQNRPAIKYRAIDSKGDPLLAKVAQGIARHVMSRSNASQAEDLAAENQVTGGFGYWRIITEYAQSQGFEQEIRIEPIWDPLSVIMDPLYKMPDGSDAEWVFVTEKVNHEEFKRRFPDAEVQSWDKGPVVTATSYTWITDDSVLLADYYCKVHTKSTIYQLADGSVVEKVPDGAIAVNQREVDKVSVKWYTINGKSVLETHDWPGSILPVIPVFGRSYMVDGIRYYHGIVRNSKDPQRNYNFWETAATELIALAPKAPFIGAEGQFEGHEQKWNNANNVSYPYLEYKPTTIAGQPAPPPQRQPFAGVPQGVIEQLERSRQDMRTTTGIYQAALGQQGNEVSGRAIVARSRESDNSVFDFPDNQARAIALTGRAILELIPAVYDTQRIVRMVNDDDTEIVAEINGPNLPLKLMESAAYDVIADVGPSYATKRAEAAESLMTFVKQIPAAGNISADLIAKNMDWPGADELSQRLKLMLPPQIQAIASSKTPEMAAMQQHMQQMDSEAKQAVQHVTQQAQAKIAELSGEVEKLEQKLADRSADVELKRTEQQVAMRELDLKEMELLMNAGNAKQDRQQKAQERLAELLEKRRDSMLKYATQRNISLDQVHSHMATAAMNARMQREKPESVQ